MSGARIPAGLDWRPSAVHEIPTPAGVGRVHVWRPDRDEPNGVVVLGHGAGPSISTVDLLAARDGALQVGFAAAIIEQPWLVAGGRVAARPPVLDSAWVPILAALRAAGPFGEFASVRGPFVVAGRSAGARVACRTAGSVGAAAVLCLSFPLHPPGKPERSRIEELLIPLDLGLPVTVVQGERDPFGSPALLRQAALDAGRPGRSASAGPQRLAVDAVPGTHTIPTAARAQVIAAVVAALPGAT